MTLLVVYGCLDSSNGNSNEPVYIAASWVRIPFKPDFFQALLFPTAKVISVNAMIFRLLKKSLLS